MWYLTRMRHLYYLEEFSLRITSVKPKKNRTQYEVFIDNTLNFTMDYSLIMKHDIKKDKIVDEKWLYVLENDINYKKAYDYSIRLLAIKDRVTEEIISKLNQKGYNKDLAIKVIEKLEDIGYIDDEKYIKNMINDKKEVPGLSKKALLYKLRSKGIDSNLLEKCFSQIEFDDYKTALLAAEKQVRKIKGDNKTIKNKIYLFLKRKGYSENICCKVLKDILESSEWE